MPNPTAQYPDVTAGSAAGPTPEERVHAARREAAAHDSIAPMPIISVGVTAEPTGVPSQPPAMSEASLVPDDELTLPLPLPSPMESDGDGGGSAVSPHPWAPRGPGDEAASVEEELSPEWSAALQPVTALEAASMNGELLLDADESGSGAEVASSTLEASALDGSLQTAPGREDQGEGDLAIPQELEGEELLAARAATLTAADILDGATEGPELEVSSAVLPEGEELTLLDDDVAPASAPVPPPPSAPSASSVSVSVPSKGVPKPPPPPRRIGGAAASVPSVAAEPKRRGPWWEEAFSDDFIRSHLRPKWRQVGREVDFIVEASGLQPGAVVLDLACGSGHHAVELASRGFAVVGFDLALDQLATAAEVAHERGQKLNFIQGDMREMAFEEAFDGVLSWDTSFGYFEEEKNVQVAHAIHRALRPGGMLVLDVLNRDYVVANPPAHSWYSGDACACMDDVSFDVISSRVRVKRSVLLDDGRSVETYVSIRLYSLHELGKLLHDVGFRILEASGQTASKGAFFGANSPRIIIVAQRV